MKAITISRQYGCGGRKIAARVCELLEYRLFDKWLMARLAAEVWFPSSAVADFSEEHYTVKAFMTRLREMLGKAPVARVEAPVRSAGQGAMPPLSIGTMDETAAVTLVNAAIVAAYNIGNVVIVGRGGQVVLRDKPDVFHVRIEAPLETRIARLQENQNLSAQEARRLIAERDKAGTEYMERCHGAKWNDSLLYDLVINTGRWPLENAARLIVDAYNELNERPVSDTYSGLANRK